MAHQTSNEARTDDSAGADLERLLTACRSGDEAAVQKLLTSSPSLAASDGEFGPLHYAVREGHERIVEQLLQHGADPHAATHNIWGHHLSTFDIAKARGFEGVVKLLEDAVRQRHQLAIADDPLRRALRDSDLPAIKLELQKDPSRVNSIDEHGNTPLHRAAQAAESEETTTWIKFLLEHGAKIDVLNNLGLTPIYVSLWRNQAYMYARPHWSTFELLLAGGAEYDINLAAAKGDIERIRQFLAEDGSAVHFQAPCKKRPLSCAAEFGHRDIVELLLNSGADPNAQEAEFYHTFPLVAAVARNDLRMVEMLLEHGADPNARIDAAEVAVGDALVNGNTEMANLIASYGGAQPVHCHAWDGDIVTLAAVLKENPSLALQAVYIPNPDKPKEAAQALRLAIHHGLDPKQIAHWSLYRASGNAELLRTFLAAGANPNVTSGEGRTLLHYLAADPSAKESIRVLLEFGAAIDARDDIFRGTPLTWAAILGNQEMVEFFLANGASVNLPDDDSSNTPTFWAEYLGHQKIANLLAVANQNKSE